MYNYYLTCITRTSRKEIELYIFYSIHRLGLNSNAWIYIHKRNKEKEGVICMGIPA